MPPSLDVTGCSAHKWLEYVRNGGASAPARPQGCYLEIMFTGQLPGAADARSSAALALPAAVSRAAQAVVPALAAAADRTGVDFGALFHTARLESGFNPAARAKTSSATGLFQFIDATWLQMLKRHGPAHGIGGLSTAQALALRKDPGVSSLMAAEHMADNARALEAGLGRPADRTDLYLAHFLGLGGAMRFLQGMALSPEAIGAGIFPAAARANKPIFYAAGAARSLQQIHQLLAARLSSGAEVAPRPAVGAPQHVSPDAAPSFPAADAARVAYLLLAEMGA